MIYLCECSSHTPETMRNKGRKTVGMEVVGEIKYMRDLALAFIENKSNDGNWFGNLGSKRTLFAVSSVLNLWVFVCHRMSQKPRSDRNFSLYISPATLNFKVDWTNNLECCINYIFLLEITYSATDACSNVTWLFSSEHNFEINSIRFSSSAMSHLPVVWSILLMIPLYSKKEQFGC